MQLAVLARCGIGSLKGAAGAVFRLTGNRFPVAERKCIALRTPSVSSRIEHPPEGPVDFQGKGSGTHAMRVMVCLLCLLRTLI